MPISFPTDYDDNICYVVVINKALIPLVGGLLKITEKRGFWLSEDDYSKGYNAIVELEACLMATCLNDLIESNDRIYRLLDTTFRGTIYSGAGTPESPVIPIIQPYVDIGFVDQNSVFGQLDRTTQLIDASINGTDTPLYTISPSVRALLQSILDAQGSDDEELGDILAKLELIATLVA